MGCTLSHVELDITLVGHALVLAGMHLILER